MPSELDIVRASLMKKTIQELVELHEDMMKNTPSLPAGETTTIRTGLPLNYWRALGIEKGRI